ncbi:transporter [Luteimonas chenhongjianii]|uniref:Transporter n=1 Tax=Luteimonas chenhongjianii TaxID=2006110 RepID=A0A290XHD3_9GAMM|nr:RDD family protein [Luteimonas chenhongjianii]ATD68483.1 transporter [Luteimonas chenhongjianii]
MTDWYYTDARNTRHGPVTLPALLQLRRDGIVHDATLLWREGLADWQPLRELAPELAADGAAPGVMPSANSWALEPVPPPTEEAPHPVQDPGWRAVAAAGGVQSADAAGRAAGAGAGSPYAPPASNVARRSTAVLGRDVVLAGFWKRVAAYLIDSVIVGLAGMALAAFALSFAGVAGLGRGEWMNALVTNLISIALSASYYAWFHASHSMATPGKMAVGIKVVRLDGERISLARAIGRYFATILSGMIFGIGFLMAGFTERKQALHDMVCDTLVVDRWAFTAHPELQRRELGTVAVVVLAIGGVLLGLALLGIVAAVGLAVLS